MISACSSNVDYEYMKGFERYLSEVHEISLKDVNNSVYYLIPLNGCDYCALENMRAIISTQNKSVVPILVGFEISKDIEDLKKELLQDNRKVLFDEHSKVSKYETGFFKPIVVHVKDGKLEYYKYVTDDLISDVFNYLIKT
jgi:hypothetical protein